MITTLTGANTFGLQAELTQLQRAFVAEHGDMALERLDGESVEFNRISEALTSVPFLAARKLVVLRNGAANKPFIDHVEQLLDNLPDTTDVILVEPKLDKRLSYYKYLKKQSDFKEFAQLDQPGMARWLVEEVKRREGSISPTDARFLVERVGLDQQLLASELEKLLLYAPHITRQTIELLTEPTPQGTIFELLTAAFAGRQRQALDLYQEQREQKVDPLQIIAMLAWQLHIVALIKTAKDRSPSAIASEARVSPFVVQKSATIARQLTLPRLKALVDELLTIDMRSKREAIDIDEALQNYLLKLGN